MIDLAFFSIPTYTAVLASGIIASAAWLIWHTPEHKGATMDVLLAALLVGIIFARAGHVALNWAYFSRNGSEIVRLQAGGLNWHGAVVGGLLGAWVMARWRQVDLGRVLDAAAIIVPVLAFAGWWGCGIALCAYGAEVATITTVPAGMAHVAKDVFGIIAPRFNTQGMGMAMNVAIFVIMLLVMWRGGLRYRRLWLALFLTAMMMLAMGIFRGDYALMVRGLRLDMWFDSLLGAMACVVLFVKYPTSNRPDDERQ